MVSSKGGRVRKLAARLLIGCLTVLLSASTSRAGQLAPKTPLPARTNVSPQEAQGSTDLLWRTEPTRLFSVVGLKFGVDQGGDLTLSGRGRFFAPFGRRSALQVDGSYDWYHDSRDGQLDVALLNRVQQVQVGLFSSIRYVNPTQFETGRALSQVGATVDYAFDHGQVGVYGTAALRDTARLDVDRNLRTSSFSTEASLRLVDQFGASGHLEVSDRLQLNGQLAILKPAGRSRTTGGAVKLAYLIAPGWALTAEGDWNPARITNSIRHRFMIGVRLGEWPSTRASLPARSRPATSQPAAESAPTRPMPIEIPAIRYQVLSRRVRDGNTAPVADAGPDRVYDDGCTADVTLPCFVTVDLDGSGSFDPDGEDDVLAYQWTKRSGFATNDTLTTVNADGSRVRFQARPGTKYVIRLQVSDPFGAIGIDEVTIEIRSRLP